MSPVRVTPVKGFKTSNKSMLHRLSSQTLVKKLVYQDIIPTTLMPFETTGDDSTETTATQ